jgi:hypothetical protein
MSIEARAISNAVVMGWSFFYHPPFSYKQYKNHGIPTTPPTTPITTTTIMSSQLTFASHPPNDDDDLANRILDHAADHDPPIKVAFTKDTTWAQAARVVAVARDGVGIDVDRMVVPALVLLRGYEDAAPDLPSQPLLLRPMRKLKAHLTYQRAPRQMNLLALQLSQSGIEELELKMNQHRTDAFLAEDPEFRALDREMGGRSLLVPIMMAPTPRERLELEAAEDGQRLARSLIESIGGEVTMMPARAMMMIANAPQQTTILAVDGRHATVRADCPLLDLDAVPRGIVDEITQQPGATTTMVAIRGSGGGSGDNGKHLSNEDENATLRAFLVVPLPESLRVLYLQVTFPRSVGSDHVRFITRCHALEELTLNYCSLTDAAMDVLARELGALRNLRSLSLVRNRLVNTPALGTVIGPSLRSLSLAFNPLTGDAITALLGCLHGNSVLRALDLENTNIRAGALSFDDLDRWAVPDAYLRLPSVFTADEIAAIESVMPDGGTLELASVLQGSGGGARAVMIAAAE